MAIPAEARGVPEAPAPQPPRALGSALTWALVAVALVAIPFLVVRFPPITDLPQHAAQIRLFGEAVGDPHSPYQIQWLTPYGLSFVILGAAWLLFGPGLAGKVGFLVVAALWAAAVHALAARRGRPISAALLATVMVFSHVLYWGFFSFLAGFVLFCAWIEIERSTRSRPLDGRRAAVLVVTASALYFTHALWFAAAALWLAIIGAATRRPWRQQASRLACLIPQVALALWWFPQLAERGFTSTTFWGDAGLPRLAPAALRDAALGGLRGSTEPLLLATVAVWIGLALWAARGRLRESVDVELLGLAAILVAAAVVLPYKFENTTRFAHRWMPAALAFLLLAMPPLAIRARLRRVLAVALLGGFVGATALTWRTFEDVELAGLRQVFDALPQGQRVLGLSYVAESPRIREHPFIQTFAYAQVLRGGELNFSFADFAPCLVVYRPPRPRPWTLNLEWLPRRVRYSDFAHFDYLVLHGDPAVQAAMIERTPIEPVTAPAPWRLYRVRRE